MGRRSQESRTSCFVEREDALWSACRLEEVSTGGAQRSCPSASCSEHADPDPEVGRKMTKSRMAFLDGNI